MLQEKQDPFFKEDDATETSLVIFGKDAIEISNNNVYG
jgi:hypothetical protein